MVRNLARCDGQRSQLNTWQRRSDQLPDMLDRAYLDLSWKLLQQILHRYIGPHSKYKYRAAEQTAISNCRNMDAVFAFLQW